MMSTRPIPKEQLEPLTRAAVVSLCGFDASAALPHAVDLVSLHLNGATPKQWSIE